MSSPTEAEASETSIDGINNVTEVTALPTSPDRETEPNKNEDQNGPNGSIGDTDETPEKKPEGETGKELAQEDPSSLAVENPSIQVDESGVWDTNAGVGAGEAPETSTPKTNGQVEDKELPPAPEGEPSEAKGASLGVSAPIENTSSGSPNETTNGHSRQHSTVSLTSGNVDNSHIFKITFEHILNSKDAKKNEALKNLVQKALDSLTGSRDPNVLFDALKVVCETGSTELKIKAVDLFAKLFDYGSFDDDEDKVRLTDASVDVVLACFEGEGTDPEIELQVVRALMHSILLMPCHGASLLKAVRQIYNVFIFSLVPRNQAVAQGILTQVISSIFLRITDSLTSRLASNVNLVDSTPAVKLTLQNLENLNEVDSDRVEEANRASEKDEDLAVKDAFLVFRSMCKLSIKPIDNDTIDMRLHSVRSKLLSLHIIHTILREHIDIFLNQDVVLLSLSKPARLINAVRDYLSVAIARNAASPLAPVFELTLEIFWLIISNLRSEFKDEIPVFWDEIYFPVAEMKTSTPHQKRYLLLIIERLCSDSRCIIEFYLNYDCDSNMSNLCEKIIDFLTKLSLVRVDVTPNQKAAFAENKRKGISVYDISRIANLTTNNLLSKAPEPDVYNHFPLEYALKMTSINCSVAFLRSLYSWAQKGIPKIKSGLLTPKRDRSGTAESSSSTFNSRNASFVDLETDDPEQFESLKQRKKQFLEGIRQFNQKPKRGIAYFLEHNFIESNNPRDIAVFLLETDGLDKAQIGEYLGEGDEHNIAIMHAFVDQMSFDGSDFVDSMRLFLQAFRLPGEAQKIDRYMLKFAERYVLGNPGVFSNADAAYVLAYSVIMLNTDLHSPQIKNRMTLDSFVANNAGIDDGKDLPRDFLAVIYDKIQNDEIKLQSEQHAALLAGEISQPSAGGGLFGSRDPTREAYNHASREMSTKTEKLVRNLGRRVRSDDATTFHAANHVHHVKSIFDTLWMSILAGLTPPFKEYDEPDVSKVCLEGIKLSIKIACMFELEYARTSYIGALVQFENLQNYEEMKPKNVAAIQIMLELAVSEGDALKESWYVVLTSISQLERLKLIAQGVDQDSIPDVSAAKLVNRASIDSTSSRPSSFFSFNTATAAQNASSKFHNQHLPLETAQLLNQIALDVAIDKVFSNSAKLLVDSMTQFVRALSTVSHEEIESSGQSANPRTFSLQKVVDICYYNMSRIRLEWSQLWAIMGETFNEVGTHSNKAIASFALDSLRQLSMRFLDIDELAQFKFQKEFLKPFEHVILQNIAPEIKDMVLDCIDNMIRARASHIRSGWKTILGVLTAAANENSEALVAKTYKMANWINREYFPEVSEQGAFGDLVVCFTVIAKNDRFQRLSLLSLEVLSRLIKQLAGDSLKSTDELVKLWFPVLFGFHDIIMTGEELEVRSRALSYLFDSINEYGEHFESEFWDMVCKQLLFPIFGVLSNHWELNSADIDKLLVWLSTTLIQALRNMVLLFTHYFEPLSKFLDEYLDLIISCICQENDTIARIGRSCLYTLLIDNANRFNEEQWLSITDAFSKLFDLTTAKELFTSDPLKQSNYIQDDDESDVGSALDLNDPSSPRARRLSVVDDTEARLQKSKEKSLIVVKCVLQLLMIETLSELFENETFYEAVPYKHLNVLAGLLLESYKFAKTFNDDYNLRVRLWNARVIERLPNLLKQESSSSAVFLNIMFRMYCDDDKTDDAIKKDITGQIVPLCNTILRRYTEFDDTNQQKNISTWRPVIVEIYQGFVEFDDDDFVKHAPAMYSLTLSLLARSVSTELRLAVKTFLGRVGDAFVHVQ